MKQVSSHATRAGARGGQLIYDLQHGWGQLVREPGTDDNLGIFFTDLRNVFVFGPPIRRPLPIGGGLEACVERLLHRMVRSQLLPDNREPHPHRPQPGASVARCRSA